MSNDIVNPTSDSDNPKLTTEQQATLFAIRYHTAAVEEYETARIGALSTTTKWLKQLLEIIDLLTAPEPEIATILDTLKALATSDGALVSDGKTWEIWSGSKKRRVASVVADSLVNTTYVQHSPKADWWTITDKGRDLLTTPAAQPAPEPPALPAKAVKLTDAQVKALEMFRTGKGNPSVVHKITQTQVINRLLRCGLLEENPDESDDALAYRATPAGIAALKAAK